MLWELEWLFSKCFSVVRVMVSLNITQQLGREHYHSFPTYSLWMFSSIDVQHQCYANIVVTTREVL